MTFIPIPPLYFLIFSSLLRLEQGRKRERKEFNAHTHIDTLIRPSNLHFNALFVRPKKTFPGNYQDDSFFSHFFLLHMIVPFLFVEFYVNYICLSPLLVFNLSAFSSSSCFTYKYIRVIFSK